MDRKPLCPNVIEINFQAGHVLGCNVYIVYDGNDWAMIDIGYDDCVDEIVEIVRQLDFPLSKCQTLIATHADVDHSQGLAKAKQLLRTTVTAHSSAAKTLEEGDPIKTFAEIPTQGIHMEMPKVKVENHVEEGDKISIGQLELEVWHTPGHTEGQLSFRLRNLLFSADNIYRDGCVGAIDAHHGSNIPDFIRSLERIRDSDIEWLLPSHGPAFRKDNEQLNRVIDRLRSYLNMADFGTCATGWPLMDQWEQEVADGQLPDGLSSS